MDLEIKYENGSMIVHIEELLNCRNISKVKKLLKVIRCSYTPECEQQIKEFVQEQTERFEQVQKEHSIYIESCMQKVRYAERQIIQTKHIISQIQSDVSKLQFIRDSHRKNTKVWKNCNADVKKQRKFLKEPRERLKDQNKELKELKTLMKSRQHAFDSNIRNNEFYKKVLQIIT
ncbi:hypothetical protein [Sporofaciens sp. SGI.106]|uniref:hypothetical protein n=1 Tax=Sporofaciens sp. SGI.106 TaxID=3420568 RepID=UPI003D08A2FF